MPEIIPQRRVKVPGLVWVRRRKSFTPYWQASDKNFKPRTVNLASVADQPDELAKRCDAWQAEMLEWRFARTANPLDFDGTIGRLSRAYQTHPQSSFRRLAPSSRHAYLHYLKRIEVEIGSRTVNEISGLDLKQWHEKWSEGGKKLAGSRTCRQVLRAMVDFGVEARLRGCSDLATSLRVASRALPGPRPRSMTVAADDVVRLRAAAHADGRPSSALAYALVFETTLRLWDVIGQWLPAAGVTGLRRHRNMGIKKWAGLCWEDIAADLVMRYVPSKTSEKTGLAVTFPLAEAPMVMEELAYWPQEARQGPVIVNANTSLPWAAARFAQMWARDRKTVGLSPKVWARDLRASGITEGRAAGVAIDDVAKVAGHSSARTTSAVYDRAAHAAALRFAKARVLARREKANQEEREKD
jgi:integrase